MDPSETKRAKPVALNALHAKAQNLPLLCVEAICKFTPTSQLVRFYSAAVPLPGACWNYGVEAVLKKRLPLSVKDNRQYHQAAAPRIPALLDSGGIKVASVVVPEAFRFSPLCQFVESATLSLRAVDVSRWTMGTGFQLYVVRGAALLSQLSKLRELALVVRNDDTPESEKFTADGDLLDLRNLAHLLPQLTSFEISIASDYMHAPFLDSYLVEFMRAMPLHDMPCLRRLILPEKALVYESLLSGVMQSATNNSPRRRGTRLTLSGLGSLGVWQNCQGGAWYSDCVSMRPEMVRFVTACCTNVSTLSLIVDGDFGLYLAAFRALTGLNTLGMYLLVVNRLTLTSNRNETFTSVVDLRFACANVPARSDVFAIASRFPSVNTIAFQYHRTNRDALELAVDLCEKRVVPHIGKLRCFPSCESSAFSIVLLLRFLGSPNLPEAVDLSQASFEILARDPTVMARIYSAMQSNSAKSLLLRGPLHREALQCLQGCVESSAPGEKCSITSRLDRDLGDQPGMMSFSEISQQRQIKIVGTKTFGNLSGEQFTIRIVHQLAKRSRIFD